LYRALLLAFFQLAAFKRSIYPQFTGRLAIISRRTRLQTNALVLVVPGYFADSIGKTANIFRISS
jgi:hypothetical protein